MPDPQAPGLSTTALCPPRTHVEVLTFLRFDECEWLLPVGVAGVEEDEQGRPVVALRLAFTDRRMFVPLWDLLTLVGIAPRVVSRYLRRRAFVRPR